MEEKKRKGTRKETGSTTKKKSGEKKVRERNRYYGRKKAVYLSVLPSTS